MPCTTSTLRALAIPPSPLVSLFTTPSLNARSLSRSMGGAAYEMPWPPSALTSSITDAVCRSALDGMQPTLRQTPPSV